MTENNQGYGSTDTYAAYKLVDAFDKELEVFTAWTVF